MQLLLATTPILIVLIGIVVLKKPTWIVSLIAFAYTFILAITAFKKDVAEIGATTQSAVISALQVGFLVWGAFALLELMTVSTGMNRIKITVGTLTKDTRVQAVLIAFCLGTFIEGATGNGAPAAILAPFLLGLGFQPILAAAACLICNGMSPCFGGAGVPTIAGMGGITDKVELSNLVAMTGRFLMIGIIFIPAVMLLVLFGKKSLKGMWGYLAAICITMSLSMFLVSNFIGAELADMVTGVVGVIVSVIYIKVIGVKDQEEYTNKTSLDIETKVSTLKAFSPYILLLILLPAVRFSFPLSALTKYGYATWIALVIHLVVFISSLILGCGKEFLKCEINGLRKLIKPIIALCALFALANITNTAGMMSLIAQSIATVAGPIYPAAAVVIGALGAFMTGSCLGSNRLFAPMHIEAASSLGINKVVSATASSAGAALGNMICPNNVIAVNATLELKNSEGVVMKRTVKAFVIMSIIYAGLALLYTYVLFPGFGL
ncbi:L-lactate permease [Lachnospiraceae bacterium PF1-21]|uniref:L-lactate permease n=1 Tax=Ohessyouella blattaphilus TaxID=2949333 RepID=UPI003E2EB15E